MATDSQHFRMTEAEYLAYDRASEYKHEYHNGEVVAMSGGTVNHSTLAGNMFYLLKRELEKNECCQAYASDMRVCIDRKHYVYPDVTVSCRVSDHQVTSDILCFPRLVVEVLSPSTEKIDRGKKFQWYTQHPSIDEYVLISTRIQWVELYRREHGPEGESWNYFSWSAGEEIELESLGLRIAVDELYADLDIRLPEEGWEQES